MSKQEPGGHSKGSTVPASDRHRQEDQTHRKRAESKRPETRSGARHVHFETLEIHGDHSGNRQAQEEPQDTHRHHEDNRRQRGEPLSGTSNSQDQKAKHSDRERSKEDAQGRTAAQHLRDSKGIAETAHDTDRPDNNETKNQYEEMLRRYLSATRHRAASGRRQIPDPMQGLAPLLTEHRSNRQLPTKANRLQYLQNKRECEVIEESFVFPRNERLSSILPKAMDRGHDSLIKLWDEVEHAKGECDLCERLLLGSVLMMLLDSLHTAVMVGYAGAEQRHKDRWVQIASRLEEKIVAIASQTGRAR
ncbi:hypothetical protein A7U60_g5825 [Sanghuangporus baumii]|uniref:Uncharacterized protein n=1 Tax=Sanghuangporus baumii TaxID=108892 RepID=A0A9Q5N2Z8_SANBA|nr:hypothetical protein A7U60_g5825 [Sanghuangporus baumii]